LGFQRSDLVYPGFIFAFRSCILPRPHFDSCLVGVREIMVFLFFNLNAPLTFLDIRPPFSFPSFLFFPKVFFFTDLCRFVWMDPLFFIELSKRYPYPPYVIFFRANHLGNNFLYPFSPDSLFSRLAVFLFFFFDLLFLPSWP